jgi:23S rRNA pseudouridine2605 synthase
LRLNQAIAQTGYCSRRKADELIAAGKVRVNGVTCTEFGRDIDPAHDQLEVGGKRLSFKTNVYVALNKPRGVVTTTADEQDRKTVLHLLPKDLRHLKPVGRLDMYSEGLLILTNDGDFALKLTHPRHHVPKLYIVRVAGELSDKHARLLANGVELEDGKTAPADVDIVERNKSYTEVEITLREGRNRQIRRMFASLGYTVQRLVRLAIGGLQLDHIAPGSWRYLSSQEVNDLLTQSTEVNDA